MLDYLQNFGLLKNVGETVRAPIKMLLYPNNYSSDRYVSYLRSKGIKIGENTVFFSPTECHIDTSRPSLISIGNSVKMTRGVTMRTHDYGWSVIRHEYGDIFGSAGEITVHDNVFIGEDAMILKDVTIGENTIIAAKSLVNKDIPPNVVAGGVPAKKIMNLDEYYEKRKREHVEEAKAYARAIQRRFDRKPRVEDFAEFFPLFLEREPGNLRPEFERNITDNGWLSDNRVDDFLASEPMFESFEAFLEYCDID